MNFSTGLFEKAILQSGTRTCAWSFTRNPTEMAFKLGNSLGFRGTDKVDLLEFLKNTRIEKITAAIITLMDTMRMVRSTRAQICPQNLEDKLRKKIYHFRRTTAGISRH